MANDIQINLSEKLTDKLLSVADALPKDFNRERFVQNCIAVMNEHPELAKINPAHTIQGLVKGAYLGLDFLNRECYLIPYENTVQFQTDYKGEIKFTKKYSTRPILDIYAKVVRDGDEFIEEIIDGRPSITFKPKVFSTADIIGAFAVVLFKDGGMLYETMSTDDINSVRRNYSKYAQSNAWTRSYGEMCRKTVLRRLSKHIDTDFESIEARSVWEEASGMDFKNEPTGNSTEIVDVFADVVGEVKEDAE